MEKNQAEKQNMSLRVKPAQRVERGNLVTNKNNSIITGLLHPDGKSGFAMTIIFVAVVLLLIYTRFVNLGWGLPYIMHPDERNMAVAVQNLNCEVQSCFNPHFFAYGQFPLYLAYIGIWVWKLMSNNINTISFNEATMSLRVISALASVVNVWVLVRIVSLLIENIKKKNKNNQIKNKKNEGFFILYSLFFFLVPYSIQFTHFGTTESLLMLFYSLLIYFSLQLFKNKILNSTCPSKSEGRSGKFIILNSIVTGLALATKVSSIWFILVPMVAIVFSNTLKTNKLTGLIKFVFGGFIVAVIFSPYNLLDLPNFLRSMGYESDVALGRYVAFYTRQFIDTVPVIFQSMKIFPYALGWPIFVLGLGGLFILSWKNRGYNLIRFALLIYFVPNAFVFAKWTRFMAPVMPIFLLFVVLFLLEIKVIKIIKIIIIIVSILPGLAYLSIYQNPDVRFQASEWIYQNIPVGSKILSETANVVDIPLASYYSYNRYKNYKVLSFDFYNLDESLALQYDLQKAIEEADYIFVPSRRIWANHTCIQNQKSKISLRRSFSEASKNQKLNEKCKKLEQKYPILNQYYDDLFSGKLGFKLVKEFESYPKIDLFSKTIYKIPDEAAEETWSVFDHPVIRIYKKM